MTKLEAYRKVCELAGAAVLETPRVGNAQAYVRRSLLNRIEDALIAAGFDMQAARAKLDADTKAERKQSRTERDVKAVAAFPLGACIRLVSWRPPLPDRISRYDIGFVVAPDASTRPRRGKPDQVYVRWNVVGEPRTWVSAHDIEVSVSRTPTP
jgi:hypothetical protein